MKKKNLLALCSALLVVAGLSGCGETKDGVIENMLSSLRKGFKLDSNVTLLADFVDPDEDDTEQKYKINYVFQNVDMVATQTELYVIEEDGTEYLDFKQVLVENENGTASYLELNHKNEIEKITAVDDLNTAINFGYYLGNPFSYIIESDFTKESDNVYSLSKEKACFLATRLYGSLDDIFYSLIESATFTFENNSLKSFNITPTPIWDNIQSGYYDTLQYKVSATVEANVLEMGSAKVDVPQVKEHKSEHDALSTALKNVKDNYTITSNFTHDITNLMTGERSASYWTGKYYYTEDYVLYRPAYDEEYVGYHEGDQVLKINDNNTFTAYGLNAATGKWDTAHGISNMNSLSHSDLIPEVSGVAPEVFDYDAETGIYSVCEELKAYMGCYAFLPLLDLEPLFAYGYGTKCEITLGADGNISKVYVEAINDSGFYYTVESFELTYENIGTTSLPSDIEIA